MRIKTRFLTTIILSIIIVGGVGLAAVVTNQEAQKKIDQAEIASNISLKASELSYLSGNYLIHPEAQQIARWRSSFASFLDQIDGLNVDTPEERMIAANIYANSQRLKEIFENIMLTNPNSEQITPDSEFFHISWGRLAIQSQSIIADAARLSRMLREDANHLALNRTIFLYSFFAVLGLFFLFNYTLTYRYIIKSLDAFHNGAKIIGSGNLDFKIKKEKDDEIGEVVVAFNQMVEERKQAETALQAERKRLFDVLETIPAMVCLLTQDYHVAFANRSFRDRFGESNGIHCYEYYGRTEPCEFCESYNVLKTGQPHHWEVNTQDGSVIDAYDFPFIDVDGSTMVLAMDIDITAQRHAEEELKKHKDHLEELVEEQTANLREKTAELSLANIELEKASRLKDEFMASMSHELRTPINGILGMSEVLSNGIYGAVNKQQLEALQAIDYSGNHLLDLINDILDISKITVGQLQLEKKTISVRQVCEASMKFIEREAQKKRLRVSTSFDGSVVTAEADERRLKQILVNLLSNAVKFTNEGGYIGLEVTGDAENERLQFTVWDTGIGISEEQLPKLFQPFVQLDSKLSRKYEGTGLGLALTRQLAILHNGSISVESELGKGSRFTLSLPWKQGYDAIDVDNSPKTNHIEDMPYIRDSESIQSYDSKPLIAMANGETKKPMILLVDDNEISIKPVSAYLLAKGYYVIVAYNAKDALQRLEEAIPDLILMDIQMPDMDGLQAIRIIRSSERFADVPIIALTALAMPGDRERCLEEGADDYISKPVSMSDLSERISLRLNMNIK